MQVKNTTPFAFGFQFTSRRPPEPELTLVLRGRFDLVHQGALSLPSGPPLLAQGSLQGDRFDEQDDDRLGVVRYPNDFADFKLKGEVMLRGTCHVPHATPTPTCPVRFEVGAWGKNLRVVGPRVWAGDAPGPAAAFTTMSLGYENAFGGPGYAPNPAGRGFGTRELPTLEAANEPLASKRDRPSLAGFGPLNPRSPDQRARMGKTKNRQGRVFHNEDFDWAWFQSAPADQWLDGYLRGDEALLFQNMHPEIPIFTSRLPGLRARAFVNDVEGRFREVKMNLDTLFADVDARTVYLTWRGVEPVKRWQAKDVKTVLFASERLDEPARPVSHYRDVLEAHERDPNPLEGLVTAEEQAEIDRMKALGAPPKQAATKPTAEGLPPAVAEKLGAVDPRIRDSVAAVLAGMLAAAASKGADVDAAMRSANDNPKPAEPMAARSKRLRAEAKAAGQPATEDFDRLDAAIADDRLAAHGVSIDGATPAGDIGPGADLAGRDLSGRVFTGADLSNANLERAILTGANLEGANLRGARLKGAILEGAEASGADFTDADLTGALFYKTALRAAKLERATITHAIFQEADLTRAVLTAANGTSPVFSKANLEGAVCDRIRLQKVIANETVLEGASFRGAAFLEGVIAEGRAARVVLTGATLERTSFFGTNLAGAALTDVRGTGTNWMRTNLAGADFGLAVLPKAMFTEASCTKAKFYGADLREAKFCGANLDGAILAKANLLDANFTGASIAATRFNDANLFGASLVMVTGTQYDLTGANTKHVTLEPTDARR